MKEYRPDLCGKKVDMKDIESSSDTSLLKKMQVYLNNVRFMEKKEKRICGEK